MAPALSLLAGVPPRPSFLGDVTLTPLRSIPVVAPTLSPSLPRCRGQGWSPACPLPNASSTTGAVWGPYCAAEGLHRPSSPSPSPPRGGCTIPSALPPGLGGKDAGKGQEEAAGTDVGAALRPKDEVPGASSPPALLPLPCTSPEPPRPPALMGCPPPRCPTCCSSPSSYPGASVSWGTWGGVEKKNKTNAKKNHQQTSTACWFLPFSNQRAISLCQIYQVHVFCSCQLSET